MLTKISKREVFIVENILTKEQLLEFIRENNIQSVSDIYESLKDLFKDV